MPWSTLTSPGGPCSILAPLAAQSSGRSGLFRSMTVRSTALSSTMAKRTSLLVRFASDSPLEGDGFELPVPRKKKSRNLVSRWSSTTSSAISFPDRRFGSSDPKRRRNGAARPSRHDNSPPAPVFCLEHLNLTVPLVLLGPVERQIEFRRTRRCELGGLPALQDPEQSKRFIEMAREIGAEATQEEFERAFKRV